MLSLVSVLVNSCASAEGNMKCCFVLGSATVYSRYAGQLWLTLFCLQEQVMDSQILRDDRRPAVIQVCRICWWQRLSVYSKSYV